MNLSFYSKWIFLILPLFYLSISISYLGGIHQFSLNHFDGPYDYLMNGVNLASGHLRVGNIEHPGTPVTIFSTFIVFIRHLLKDDIVIYQDVLLHPESY